MTTWHFRHSCWSMLTVSINVHITKWGDGLFYQKHNSLTSVNDCTDLILMRVNGDRFAKICLSEECMYAFKIFYFRYIMLWHQKEQGYILLHRTSLTFTHSFWASNQKLQLQNWFVQAEMQRQHSRILATAAIKLIQIKLTFYDILKFHYAHY